MSYTQSYILEEHYRRGDVTIGTSTKFSGAYGELIAAEYLKKHRYKILGAGYRSVFGEIDLIARKKNIVAFVEVKLRRNANFSRACEAVTYSKQQKIIKTALQWLANNPCDLQPRFDIIEIYTDSNEINHIENAFV